jgi:hypothetical protein
METKEAQSLKAALLALFSAERRITATAAYSCLTFLAFVIS